MLCCHITIGDCCDVAFCCSKGIHNGLESKSHCDCIRVVVIVRHCRRSNGKLFFCANISIWFDCRGKMSSNHTRYYVYSDIHDALSPVNCHNSIIQIGQQRNLNNIMRGCCVCLLCFETATAAAAASCPKIKLTPELMLNCRASLNYLLHSSRLYYIPPIKRAGEEETQLWNIVIIHILRDYDSIYLSLRIHNLASPIPARIGKWQQQQQQEGWPFERTRLNISMEVIPQFHLSGLFSYPKNDPPVCAWLTSPLNPYL